MTPGFNGTFLVGLGMWRVKYDGDNYERACSLVVFFVFVGEKCYVQWGTETPVPF